jgi:hypothetical protein
VACSGFGEDGGAKTGDSERRTQVIPEESRIPDGCRPPEVATMLVEFFGALRRADGARIQKGLSAEFKWLSMTGSPSPTHLKHFVAYKPPELVRYVAERGGFPLTLRVVEVYPLPSRGEGDFALEGAWSDTSDQSTAKYQLVGKGALECSSRLIMVLSMAVRPRGQEVDMNLCDETSDPAVVGNVTVCSRIGTAPSLPVGPA